MFRRARTNIESEQPAQAGSTLATQPSAQVATTENKPTGVTGEALVQAWTSFALELPESERALTERMKIIIPEKGEGNNYTIRVDNQLVAQIFEEQAAKIATGMSKFLAGAIMKMKIEINKVAVQRHVYDRTKQYEILREKNPAIEKLRKGLNLELT